MTVNRSQQLADDGACQHPALRTACTEDVEDCRRGHRAERRQDHRPERKRQHSGIPQREHRVIIIDAFMLSTAAIAWLPWRAESFARARAEGKPVLLSLAPTWCGHSAEMDSATFADTEVAALVTAHFVAIRVDADRRPDICERYSLGGWPTTAFLTPDGDVLGGGTFIERQRLADVLRRVSAAFAQGSGHARRRATRRRPPSPPGRSLHRSS